jgi:hypothetical protein
MAWEHVNRWPSDLTAIHAAHLRNNRIGMLGGTEAKKVTQQREEFDTPNSLNKEQTR